MSRLNTLLFLLSVFVPLAVLLLVSLSLVALKRKSNLRPSLSRLTAPPFYLVSLPVATLIVGAEMLGWYLLLILSILPPGLFSEFPLFFYAFILPWYAFPATFGSRLYLPVVFGSIIAFWAATLISGFLLWRTVWRENHRQASSRVASRLLRALLLGVCFALAFFYLASYVHELMVRGYP